MLLSQRYAIIFFLWLVSTTVTSGAPTPDPLSLGGLGKLFHPFMRFYHQSWNGSTITSTSYGSGATSGSMVSATTSDSEDAGGNMSKATLKITDPTNTTQICAVACAEKENAFTRNRYCPQLCKTLMLLRAKPSRSTSLRSSSRVDIIVQSLLFSAWRKPFCGLAWRASEQV
ncbi:BQ2448_7378 [Microbotryum intermedium]|uniref:BQ2448_7378 protein n=1 Tax=Microbotryum intermedium TaxID=269621 RepID=A0A238FI29_9BASI|nr:BQ2448_7378 [Microbotryum intermedium]